MVACCLMPYSIHVCNCKAHTPYASLGCDCIKSMVSSA